MVKKNLGLVIFLLSIGLAALIALQGYWIKSVMKLKEDQFDANVNQVLADVTNKVENNLVCFEMFSKVHFAHGEGIYLVKQKWDSVNHQEQFTAPVKEKNFVKNLDTVTTYFHYAEKTDTLFPFNSLKFSHPATVEISMKFTYDDHKHAPMTSEALIDSGRIKNYTASQLQQLTWDQKTLKEKIDTFLLDSLLHHELIAKQIPISFSYAITSRDRDSILFEKSSAHDPELMKSNLKAGLFENDNFNPAYDLRIYFPFRTQFIVSTILPVLIVSFFIILMLILVFWFAVNTLLKESKLASMKNEFINNMTHEFKTPASTIALAMDTITSPEIMNDKHKLEGFLKVLKDESTRLEAQVERVLQISRLEKNQLELNFNDVDVNHLVSNTVKDFDLYAKIKRASFDLKLDERNPMLHGDETHLRNMLYNLIDNALKYSNGRDPEIKISTLQNKSELEIRVEDNGIGMNRDELKKVFDKFYRIPTGYIHDIKGFGLGLSYVKTIVNLHKGKIKVASEPNVGSIFTIQFQYHNQQN